jgi:hypothetical protein
MRRKICKLQGLKVKRALTFKFQTSQLKIGSPKRERAKNRQQRPRRLVLPSIPKLKNEQILPPPRLRPPPIFPHVVAVGEDAAFLLPILR